MTADFLDTLKLGEPQPLKAAFRGIEYPGEILLADAWRPELGEIAKEDVHFRIVVFTKYQPVPDIADRRIACCIPGHRQLLQEAHIDIPWRPTFAELTGRFPSLEEGDIDAAAAEFTELLRKAFAKAKREHPGKRVRLSFKE